MTERTRPRAGLLLCVVLSVVVAGCATGDPADTGDPAVSLRDAGSFDSIEDEAVRSKALFVEAGRVLQHPRCLNCHPLDEHPRQGETLAMHQPPVVRGADGRGTAAARCDACHQTTNIDHAGVPGQADWHLAPVEMGWIGLSLNEICEQLKDQEQNGGMSLKQIHEHMAGDPLVAWGWSPGEGLEPVPGDQASFGRLIGAWIDSGAHCPDGAEGDRVGPEPEAEAGCLSCHV